MSGCMILLYQMMLAGATQSARNLAYQHLAKTPGLSGGLCPGRLNRLELREMTAKRDEMLARIEAYNEAKGGGVVIQKASKGYSLFREDNGRPIARLRPTGKGDQVEVMWWSHRDKWDQIGDFGPMVMSLDEALEYVAKDPIGCFWH